MRRNLAIVLALMTAIGLLAAGPVSATQPLRGDQTMVLNQDPATGEFGFFGCPELSWFGSIDIEGTTYGMALYPMPSRLTGNGAILHYEEAWKVWTEEFTLTYDPGAERFFVADCEPGDYVLAGTDSGVGSSKAGSFRSNGTVDEAFAPFADWLGRRVHQDGVLGPIDFGILEDVFGFHGDLRLN